MFIELTTSKRFLIAPEERNVLDLALIALKHCAPLGARVVVTIGSINIWLLWSQNWFRLKAALRAQGKIPV